MIQVTRATPSIPQSCTPSASTQAAAAAVDWEAAYYRIGLAVSGVMEAAAELSQLAEEQPALASDARFAAELRTAQRLRDSLQAVCASIVYPLSETARATREIAWQQALGGSRC